IADDDLDAPGLYLHRAAWWNAVVADRVVRERFPGRCGSKATASEHHRATAFSGAVLREYRVGDRLLPVVWADRHPHPGRTGRGDEPDRVRDLPERFRRSAGGLRERADGDSVPDRRGVVRSAIQVWRAKGALPVRLVHGR